MRKPAAASLETAVTANTRPPHTTGLECARPGSVEPLALPEYLTAPFPAYVSLQSALCLHGMISQVPAVNYAVSLARTRRFVTPVGTVSVHHVQPSFFFGFEDASRGSRLATPEKALVDFLFLTPARSQLFRALPELEWPKRFRARRARAIVRRVEPARRRALVKRRLDALLEGRKGVGTAEWLGEPAG